MYESVFYIDPQAVKPALFCPICGGECYAPSLICIRCENRSDLYAHQEVSAQ